MKTYHYYPGCSVKGTGKAYEESLLAVAKALGLELVELEDWNCCGATAYMSIDELQAFALAGRNLALAERINDADVVTPCSACYLVLNKAKQYLDNYPDLRRRVCGALKTAGLRYQGKTRVRHPLDIFINDVGLKEIAARVTRPLTGLKVAPYYGCQVVRPFGDFIDQRHPRCMDKLIEVAGAEVVEYAFKARCCGASQMGTLPEVGLQLVSELLQEAHQRGADVIATVCPLCQFNLEGYQDRIAKQFGVSEIPVVYFTQLLGLALGASGEDVGLNRCLVPVEPALAKGVEHVS